MPTYRDDQYDNIKVGNLTRSVSEMSLVHPSLQIDSKKAKPWGVPNLSSHHVRE